MPLIALPSCTYTHAQVLAGAIEDMQATASGGLPGGLEMPKVPEMIKGVEMPKIPQIPKVCSAKHGHWVGPNACAQIA